MFSSFANVFLLREIKSSCRYWNGILEIEINVTCFDLRYSGCYHSSWYTHHHYHHSSSKCGVSRACPSGCAILGVNSSTDRHPSHTHSPIAQLFPSSCHQFSRECFECETLSSTLSHFTILFQFHFLLKLYELWDKTLVFCHHAKQSVFSFDTRKTAEMNRART